MASVVLSKVIEPVTPKVLDKVVAPVTPKVPANVEFAPTDKLVPTNNFFAIPAPPAIVKDPPLVLLVASVVSVNDNDPELVKVPLIVAFPPIKISLIPVTLLLLSLNNRILL